MMRWLTPFHILCYYTAWFACILSAGAENPWLGPLITLPLVFIQWLVQRSQRDTKGIYTFIVMSCFFGIVIDTLLLRTGLITFSANKWPGFMTPPWMITLWLSFAALVFFCLRNFFQRYLLAGILSAIGFPLAYYAGAQFHSATIHHPFFSLFILGLLAALGIPALLFIFNKLGDNL